MNRMKYVLNVGNIRRNNPHILTSIETIEKIIKERCSLSRFGDGEFYLMLGLNLSPFQKCTPELTKDLLEVISNTEQGILIGLPDTFDDVDKYERSSKKFWQSFMGKYRNEIISCLPTNYLELTYANTNSTRFYSDLSASGGGSYKPIRRDCIRVWKLISQDAVQVSAELGRMARAQLGNMAFFSLYEMGYYGCKNEEHQKEYLNTLRNTIMDLCNADFIPFGEKCLAHVFLNNILLGRILIFLKRKIKKILIYNKLMEI